MDAQVHLRQIHGGKNVRMHTCAVVMVAVFIVRCLGTKLGKSYWMNNLRWSFRTYHSVHTFRLDSVAAWWA